MWEMNEGFSEEGMDSKGRSVREVVKEDNL
jgi:hypothetical protein